MIREVLSTIDTSQKAMACAGSFVFMLLFIGALFTKIVIFFFILLFAAIFVTTLYALYMDMKDVQNSRNRRKVK